MKTNNDYQYLNTEDCINFSEFPLAATLICLGFKLVAMDKNPKTPKKIDFVFQKNKTLEKTIKNYWDGNLLVEPKSFWNINRELKSRMCSEATYANNK